ncbi:hypothetical protein RhiirA4_470295 [Rhizophagus irregularis]|uniref:Endonuclease/exonuclease/phosphatase domain-containing protein n=1 Tax=Rhizophagus irregularis TaxID=588596 RepID=A0A2I1H129_9GLOM|nr:hypothetical protein RhiirA4_470295 [Rhizophagus irregularis]
MNTLGRTIKNGNEYTYVGFFTETAKNKFLEDTRVPTAIGNFRNLEWLNKLNKSITISATGIDKSMNIDEVIRQLENKFGQMERITHQSSLNGKINMKVLMNIKCTEEELLNTWGIFVNGRMIRTEPLNYKNHVTKQRGNIFASVIDIPEYINDTEFTPILKQTGARYWYKSPDRKRGTYRMIVQFNNEKDRQEAIKKKIKIDDKLFTWFFRGNDNGTQHNFRDASYAKRTTTEQKIATSTITTKMKDKETMEATGEKIGITKIATTAEGDTITKEILRHPEDQIRMEMTTTDIADIEKNGATATEEDNSMMITITKMKDMKIEDIREEDTNKEDITITKNKDKAMKETMATTIITEEIEDLTMEAGTKEIETMEDAAWADNTKTTPSKRKNGDGEDKKERKKYKKKNQKNGKTPKTHENQQKQIKTNKKEEKKDKLKIGCLNIRGMNEVKKQGKLRIFLGKEKWDIAIVTETKLTEQKGKYMFKGWDKYECINSSFNNDNTKSGIIILIRKSLNDRRYKVEKIDGHVIKLDILFKDKQKGIKIIGVYNPNNDKDTTGQIEKKISTWINEAKKLNQELIILGDFNESANNKKKSKPVTQTIKRNGLEDVQECLAGKDILDTWKSGENSSRIDYIFASEGILGQILSHEIIDIEDFETDHKALAIKVELKELIDLNRKEYFKQIKAELKRIKLEPEDWEIIAERFDDKLLEITETDINREEMWETMVAIYEAEKTNRINELKKIKEKEKEYENDNQRKSEEEALETLIKEYETIEKINNIEHEIIKLVRKVVKTKWKGREIGKSGKHYKSFDEQLIIEDWGTTDTGKFNAKKMISLIKVHDKIEPNKERLINIENLRKYENRKGLEEREKERNKYMIKLYEEINERIIEINIRKREIYLEEDIGKMLNRILEKKREKIDMSGLVKKENGKITIEKNQEKKKEITLEHYSNWTAKRNINLDEIEFNYEWRDIYKPIETIDADIYKKLMGKIDIEELETVIKNLKSNKAPGMSGISYDFWKKSKKLTRQILLAIINESMEKGNATEKWKKGSIANETNSTIGNSAENMVQNISK